MPVRIQLILIYFAYCHTHGCVVFPPHALIGFSTALHAKRSKTTSASTSKSVPRRPTTSLPHRSESPRLQDVSTTATVTALETTTKETVARSSGKPRKAKQKQGGKTKNKKTSSAGEALSDQDLAEHVSHLYIHGPGGILRKSANKWQTEDPSKVEQETKPHSVPSHTTRLDHHPALVLNADYRPLSYLPLSLWSWQDSVKAIFGGKLTVVDTYPDVFIRAAHLEVPLPSVLALTEYVHPRHQTPAFTKRNVFLRDEYTCQYCQQQFATRDLSLDHVVPRCRGGVLNWDNAVTSCRACNGRKGCRSVDDLHSLGMRLQRPPRAPSQYELAAIAGRMLPRRVHPTWEPYLGKSQQGDEPWASTSSASQGTHGTSGMWQFAQEE